MPKPKLRHSLLNLKTNVPNQVIWLHVKDETLGDEVTVIKQDGSDGFWEGTITSRHPDNPKGSKVKLNFNSGTPPGFRRSKSKKRRRLVGAGDIINVDITVTNNPPNGPSSTIPGQVIVD